MALIIDLSNLRQNPGRVQNVSLEADGLEGLDEGLSLDGKVFVDATLTGGERQVALTG